MKRDEDPNPWVTMLKLLIGAIVLIGSVGYALWYMDQQQSKDAPVKIDKGWGIFSDNPIRR
jgi:hypothetical protein